MTGPEACRLAYEWIDQHYSFEKDNCTFSVNWQPKECAGKAWAHLHRPGKRPDEWKFCFFSDNDSRYVWHEGRPGVHLLHEIAHMLTPGRLGKTGRYLSHRKVWRDHFRKLLHESGYRNPELIDFELHPTSWRKHLAWKKIGSPLA